MNATVSTNSQSTIKGEEHQPVGTANSYRRGLSHGRIR